jgi:hypothetical protein
MGRGKLWRTLPCDCRFEPLRRDHRAKVAVSRLAKKKSASLPPKAIFAKQKTNKAEQANDRYLIKATKEISMQHLIILAAVSMMVLYVLIIVACLCYVGRHGRRTS